MLPRYTGGIVEGKRDEVFSLTTHSIGMPLQPHFFQVGGVMYIRHTSTLGKVSQPLDRRYRLSFNLEGSDWNSVNHKCIRSQVSFSATLFGGT